MLAFLLILISPHSSSTPNCRILSDPLFSGDPNEEPVLDRTEALMGVTALENRVNTVES